jgi:hypothetical protein
MIQELSWYTKSTGNTFFSDIHFRAYNGRSYQLSYNGNTGYVIYAGREIKRHEKIAHAMLRDTQLFLKNDGSSFLPTFNIYDYKTNCYIGKLNRLGFIIDGVQYTLRQTRKSIFSRQLPCDLRFEVDEIYPDMLMRMDIDRVDKKWYKGVYGQALKGTVEFKDTIPKEVILATFFFLQNEIEAHTRD